MNQYGYKSHRTFIEHYIKLKTDDITEYLWLNLLIKLKD